MSNRRKYIRIATVLPVEFFVVDVKGKRITPWIQGFTRDIGRGGLYLFVNDLWWGFWDKIKNNEDIRLSLHIEVPFRHKHIAIEANPVWLKQDKPDDINRYIIGLEFLKDGDRKSASLFKYALIKKTVPFALASAAAVLLIFSFSWYWRAGSLARQNERIVKNYVAVVDKKSSMEETLKKEKQNSGFLKERQEKLQEKIAFLGGEISRLKDENVNLVKKSKAKDSSLRILPEQLKASKERQALLEVELASLKREKEFLKNKIKINEAAVSKIQKQVNGLSKNKLMRSDKVIEGMYGWIKDRQNPVNGLVLSYEGDKNLDKVCFTYDQALAAMAFLVFDDKQRAKEILDFYLGKVKRGQSIYNAYFIKGSVFEHVIHCGPNAWIGLAALDYVKKTNDKKYLAIARKTAELLLSMMDKEGGIRGGPKDSWYSTEHNLDAFAFFDLFYQLNGKEEYLEAAEKIEKWIRVNTYADHGPPIKRGKGDSTIATDTYAWSVTAFGPKKLYPLKMDPEMILEFATENCEVVTKFKTAGREVKVKGFDFAKARNIARGGVVSGEWTAQMILAFEIMADYFKDKDPVKSKEYLNKAMFYFNELQKMLITSVSRIGKKGPCLPYASSAWADTGHGWRTPKGDRTGSLASTAYFLLAYRGYNPLKAEFLSLSLKKVCEKELKERQSPDKEVVEWTDIVTLF